MRDAAAMTDGDSPEALMHRVVRLVPLAALALALAACGGGAAVEASSVETSAMEQFSQQFDVDSVECSEDLPAEEGATMTCVLVDGAGGSFEMTVTVTSVEDDDVQFDLELTDEL
jgi:hypothetical protein